MAPKLPIVLRIYLNDFHFWRPIRRFWQRGRRGWADEDVDEFCTYLAKVISEGAGHLRRRGNGFACMHWSSALDVDDWVGHECKSEDWDAVLKDIEEGFRDYVRAGEVINLAGERTALRRAMRPFAEHFQQL